MQGAQARHLECRFQPRAYLPTQRGHHGPVFMLFVPVLLWRIWLVACGVVISRLSSRFRLLCRFLVLSICRRFVVLSCGLAGRLCCASAVLCWTVSRYSEVRTLIGDFYRGPAPPAAAELALEQSESDPTAHPHSTPTHTRTTQPAPTQPDDCYW